MVTEHYQDLSKILLYLDADELLEYGITAELICFVGNSWEEQKEGRYYWLSTIRNQRWGGYVDGVEHINILNKW